MHIWCTIKSIIRDVVYPAHHHLIIAFQFGDD